MLAEWARDAKACKASGMTVKDWCASKGPNINAYRYRCRKLRMAAEEGLTAQPDTSKKNFLFCTDSCIHPRLPGGGSPDPLIRSDSFASWQPNARASVFDSPGIFPNRFGGVCAC